MIATATGSPPTSRPPEGRATLNVPEVARLLGIGRDAAYRAVARGEIPSLRVGRRILVPVAALERMLGATSEAMANGAISTRTEARSSTG